MNDSDRMVDTPTASTPADDPLALSLLRGAQLIEERLAPALAELGVSTEQWRVLAVLAGGEGRTMTDLSRLTVQAPATATRTVDKLISLAMVYRRVDPLDRRRVMVFLSPHGAQAITSVRERERDIETDIARSLGSRRFLALTDGLTHLTR
ncbi:MULTISPECIES: MarR family winged helix-turn-helix transcriptional regulator [unclassified Gordonia (in: high G+C Gram-positive bacteria)]|uniref:MarR family winged helix-turn-helix transcriptional regulator n=1 Tax=unclassified Gordonia (in: high G+C Gram-positive bacteria) TaxID=2657482 RepID=UPI001F10EC7D|nr:MarR family transcriptional regulator [Gordonia sp. ABSL49_1]MCH5645466.1 MarR family transcriptional regulator [Gordonia sp. ABSL49_1]